MAAEVLSGSTRGTPWPYIPAALLSSGVPLMELTFITAVRVRKGLPWWRGSPDHFSLRLQARGLSRLQTDFVAWTTAAACCAAGWALPLVSRAGQLLILGGALSFFAAAWRALLRWEVAPRGAVAQAPPPSGELSGERILRHQRGRPLTVPGAEPSDAGVD
jgi:hypothetical protein